MVDICRAAKQRGKYLPLFTDTEVNNCFTIYQTSGQPASNSCFYFLRNEGKILREFKKNAERITERCITDIIKNWTRYIGFLAF